jgi:hypothetical protein
MRFNLLVDNFNKIRAGAILKDSRDATGYWLITKKSEKQFGFLYVGWDSRSTKWNSVKPLTWIPHSQSQAEYYRGNFRKNFRNERLIVELGLRPAKQKDLKDIIKLLFESEKLTHGIYWQH